MSNSMHMYRRDLADSLLRLGIVFFAQHQYRRKSLLLFCSCETLINDHLINDHSDVHIVKNYVLKCAT